MSDDEVTQTTQLLRAWARGDAAALDQLMPRVYDELRRIAGHFMQGERNAGTMQTTALVHEAYLKLIDVNKVDWQHRAHFMAVSASLMRRILLDHARRRTAGKRGGKAPRVDVDEVADVTLCAGQDMIALDDALNGLANMDPRKARVIELRFFGGLSVEEASEVLGVSPDTVMRDWKLARAWLRAELAGSD